MNVDQWILEISRAYQSAGLAFPQTKKTSLIEYLAEKSAETPKKVIVEALDVMTRYLFKKASTGETFGNLSRIKERFGRSLEENYGLSGGPFMNMAKTYWTYKLEVGDLFPEYHNLGLSQMLLELETNIAGLFFPTSGPGTIPVNKRREAQKQILQEYAPEIDIDAFLGNNPILDTSLQDSNSFMRAYKNRPMLNALVFVLWLSVIINSLKTLYFLITGQFGNIGPTIGWGIGSFVLWYIIHNWSLRHPKD
jgi:hypothetical protein